MTQSITLRSQKIRDNEELVKKIKQEDVNEMSSEIEEIKPRKRRIVNFENYKKDIEALNKLLNTEIDRKARSREGGSRPLRKMVKLTLRLNKDLKKIAKKPRRKTTNRSGFSIQRSITADLAKFLQVPLDTKLSQNEVVCAIFVYIKRKDDEKREKMLRWYYLNTVNRNLQDTTDKMRILPDTTLSTLLNFEDYKRRVREGLEFENRLDKNTGYKVQVPANEHLLYYKISKLIKHLFVEESQ